MYVNIINCVHLSVGLFIRSLFYSCISQIDQSINWSISCLFIHSFMKEPIEEDLDAIFRGLASTITEREDSILVPDLTGPYFYLFTHLNNHLPKFKTLKKHDVLLYQSFLFPMLCCDLVVRSLFVINLIVTSGFFCRKFVRSSRIFPKRFGCSQYSGTEVYMCIHLKYFKIIF